MRAAADSLWMRFILRIRSSTIVRQSVVLFLASMVLNVGGFLFHAIASRRLGVDGYGTLFAIINASVILTLPSAVLAPVVVRFAAEFRALRDAAHVRRLAIDVAGGFAVLGGLYVVVAFVALRPLAGFLHVSAWTIPLMAAIAAVVLVGGAVRAVVAGTQDFDGLALSSVAEGVMKVVALLGLILAGAVAVSGIAGYLIGSFCGMAVVALRLVNTYRGEPAQSVRYDWRRIAFSAAGAAATTVATTLMASGDSVLVKHYFSLADAGIYGAAAQGGKILLYFVGFVATILLPKATDRHVRGERTRGVMFATLGSVLVLGGCALLAVRLYGLLLLHALFGHAFDAASALLVWYAAAMIFFAVTQLLATYGIATHRLAFAIPLLACTLATLGAIALYHPSLAAVVRVFLTGNAATSVVLALTLGIQGLSTSRNPGVAAPNP
ncbi:MAG TPA: oligosaccharide flippase family protein [Candidatus Acidoferrales bacterium]|nr:oligosaccharide flippase family protein [Candidatus Acidoferrales bacterium]